MMAGATSGWSVGCKNGGAHRLRRLMLTLAVITAACEAAPNNEAVPADEIAPTPIRDSAVIVENARPTDDSRLGWQVGPGPVLSIGTVGGTENFQLHHVDDALRLRDGRIVVANAGSHRLLVFDDEGDYLASWGQRGQGPGDFSGLRGTDGLGPPQLFWVERWPGDSLAVFHSGSAKGPMQFVSISGEFRPKWAAAAMPPRVALDILALSWSLRAAEPPSRPGTLRRRR